MKAQHISPTAQKNVKQREAFVLDGSVTLAWFFEDEGDAYTESVHDALENSVAIVPQLWRLEVINGLLVGERRKRTIEAKAMLFARLLTMLPINVDEYANRYANEELLLLARMYHLSAYDAAYLELAQRRDLPLATLDKTLQKAAKKAGVKIYRPR